MKEFCVCPLISVIVPIYKVEQYFDECVQSIIHQTYSNLEIILVDDGSPDRCPEMCDEYAKQDSRIKVIHKKNGGLSSARNAGLKVATGDYIGFVDSDDWIAPNMYETLLEVFVHNENVGVSACSFSLIFDGGVKIHSTIEDSELCGLKATQCLLKYGMNNSVWTKLYKHDVISSLKFKEGFLSEDYPFSFYCYERLMKKNKNIVFINKCLYNYRQNKNGIMLSQTIRAHKHVISHTEEILNYLKKFDRENVDLCKSRYESELISFIGDICLDEDLRDKYYTIYRNKVLSFDSNVVKLWGLRHKMMFYILVYCPYLWNFKYVRNFCLRNGQMPPIF